MRVEAIQQVFFGGTLYGPDEKLKEFEIPDEPTREIDKKKDDKITQSIAKGGKVPVAFNSKSMRPVDEKAQKEQAPPSRATDKEGKTIQTGGKGSGKEVI